MRFEPALFWRFVRSCLCGGSRHELATRATSSSLPSVRVGSNASGPVDQFFRGECSRPGAEGKNGYGAVQYSIRGQLNSGEGWSEAGYDVEYAPRIRVAS